MQAHAHDSHGPAAHGPDAPARGARDPDFGSWLGATLLLVLGLLLMFALPARHAAGPLLAAHGAGDEHATDHAGAGHAQPGATTPPDKRTEQQRIADVFGVMAGHGFSDDSVPPQVKAEVEHMIRVVAESDATFTLALEPRTPGETAAFLLEHWKRLQGEIYSSEAFLVRSLGRKLINDKAHRIRFKDGSDRPLRVWLQEQRDLFSAR